MIIARTRFGGGGESIVMISRTRPVVGLGEALIIPIGGVELVEMSLCCAVSS